MIAIKNDGRRVPLDLTQIRKQTIPATEGLENVSYEELEQDLDIMMRDEIETKEIASSLINIARNKIDLDCPDWTYVAGRLELYQLYHSIKRVHNVKGKGDVYEKVTLKDHLKYAVSNDLYSDFVSKYTKKEIKKLGKLIDAKYDKLMNTMAVDTYIKRYAATNNDVIFELPQHMFMSVAMYLAQNEEDKVYWATKFFDITRKFEAVMATPTNSNGRLKGGSTISCLLGHVPDSIEGIYEALKEVAKGSQIGSGWGIDYTNVRSKGSWIDGVKGIAGGKIPFVKNYNDTAVAVDQRGVRPGAFAIYVSVWDIDIFDFLDGKKANGDDRSKFVDIFTAVNMDNVFIERDKSGGTYTLFDPYDVKDLLKLHGAAFKKRYEEYEADFLANPENYNDFTEVIQAKDLMRKITISYNTEGQPFIHYIDNTNANHKYEKEFGMIRILNLCTEIAQPTDEKHTAVCNLGSLNLARVNTEAEIIRVTRILHRALDNSIDITLYPSEKSRLTQVERRSIGIGGLGEAEFLATNGIVFSSPEHNEVVGNIYRIIKETTDTMSKELAMEKGSCAIPGERNAYKMATAPNSTSGIFASTTNSHEATFDKIWTEENGQSSIVITAPNITADSYQFYVGAYDVDPFAALVSTRAKYEHIDMAISHNFFLRPEGLKASTIRKLIWSASDLGLPSSYYLRSKPPVAGQAKENEISCFGCNN